MRPDPRESVTGIAWSRWIPGSTIVTANRAVQAVLQWKETCNLPASACASVIRGGATNENRGGRGGAAGVLSVRSAPTAVPPALIATSR